MAYYDPTKAAEEAANLLAFKDWQARVKADEIEYKASLHIHSVLSECEEMKKDLEKYRQFFNLLSDLLPEKFGLNTPIR